MNNHILNHKIKAINVLDHLNSLTDLMTILIEDDEKIIIGSISDGDIRRGIIKGNSLNDEISLFANKKFNFLKHDEYSFRDIKTLREKGHSLIPILYPNMKLHDLIILKNKKNILPISVIIMAGGLGKRLYPLTKDCPKPLLKIRNKHVVDYCIELMLEYGINDFNFCINYQHEKFLKYFEKLAKNGINLRYRVEEKRMGTIGGVSLFDDFNRDDILVINADIITAINLEDFLETYLNRELDLCIATKYNTFKIPFAVIREKNGKVHSIKEKPDLKIKTNSGIYLMKKELIKKIKKDTFYDATDFISDLVNTKHIVGTYNFHEKWIDIGSHKDLKLFQDEEN